MMGGKIRHTATLLGVLALCGAASVEACVITGPLVSLDGFGSTRVEEQDSCDGVGDGDDHDPGPAGCVDGLGGGQVIQRGPDLVYRIAVDAGVEFDISIQPTDAWDVGAYVLTSCQPDTCLIGKDVHSSPGIKESLLGIRNSGSEPRDYYLVVDSFYPSGGYSCGAFDLEFEEHFISDEGDECTNKIPLAFTGDIVEVRRSTCGTQNVSFSPDFCGGVLPSALYGRDVHFSLTSYDTAWTATVVPDGWDAAIAVSTECGDLTGTCVAASDSSGSGENESVTVSLTDTGGAQTVTLVIDSSLDAEDPLGCGDFTLKITPVGAAPVRPTSWGGIKAIYRPDTR